MIYKTQSNPLAFKHLSLYIQKHLSQSSLTPFFSLYTWFCAALKFAAIKDFVVQHNSQLHIVRREKINKYKNYLQIIMTLGYNE